MRAMQGQQSDHNDEKERELKANSKRHDVSQQSWLKRAEECLVHLAIKKLPT